MTANPWRGEVEILLGDKKYILRPTFAALSNIEQQLGAGLVTVARKLSGGEITLEELAVIITQCALQPMPDIRDELLQGGLSGAIESVSAMLAIVFGGCDEITAQ